MIEYKVKVSSDGTRVWFLNGKLHREDGPAIECTNGANNWFLNGKRHREDGPAIEYDSGHKYWYINGEQLTEDEFNSRTNVELSLEEISEKFNIPLDKLKIKK